MKTTASVEDVFRIIYTEHHDPYTVLGIHRISLRKKPSVAVRAFLPAVVQAWVVREGENGARVETVMERVHAEGFFEAVFKGESDVFPYMLKTVGYDEEERVFHDSYAFLPQLTDFDLHLFNEGNHYKIYNKLGAHYVEINGIGGIEFAVWAPNARSVSVIGSFNNWDRRMHAMRVLGGSGVWEIFIPGLDAGELYKFEIKSKDGYVLDKTDPFAAAMEVRPRTASLTHRSYHTWDDAAWMKQRRGTDAANTPMSIYEVHLGSWRRPEKHNPEHALFGGVTYRGMAPQLAAYVKEMGYTHIELLPIMEHPFDGSWGYQVTGYYAPSSRFGSPDDFRWFIDFMHREGIGVILDWVPAHFPKDQHALGRFDGTALFEHADPRKGEHMDWGTFIFNYGRNEVRNFLIANALYWIDEFHIDGLRIDAVASLLYLDYSRKEGEWIPNEFGGRENLEAINFLRQLNWAVRVNHPGAIVIAEESTSFTGVTHPADSNGLGFDFKWNMGWMHDMLEYFQKDPLFRRYHHNNLTFGLLYAFTEQFLLPISHDEVVHGKGSLIGKMPGDYWQRFANMRAFLGFMYAHPGKKLLFMGQEFGQWNEWNHDDELDWNLLAFDAHRQLQTWVKDLNTLYRNEPALFEIDTSWQGFAWIDLHDANHSMLSFERVARNGERVVVVCNFTPTVHEHYRLGVSEPGVYRELLNSDSEFYGGSGVGNGGAASTDDVPHHDRQQSLLLRVPPLGVLFLKRND
ncbi:MAG: 1,4-alpha-glucan branching protein GlgB [Ignavibacteriae bacterium]|nr:1,4-alpha-glucan branching protein GlgB [Ignavibacteriota bacterium]